MKLQELIDRCYTLIDLGCSPQAEVQVVLNEDFSDLDQIDVTIDERGTHLAWLVGVNNDRESTAWSVLDDAERAHA